MERASLHSQSKSVGPNGSAGNPRTRWQILAEIERLENLR
jgi:hypothetical protein